MGLIGPTRLAWRFPVYTVPRRTCTIPFENVQTKRTDIVQKWFDKIFHRINIRYADQCMHITNVRPLVFMLDSSAWFRSSKRIPTHLLFQNYYLGFIGLKKFAQTMKPAAELVERTK